MVTHTCSRINHVFYSFELGAFSFDDRGKWRFAEENKVIHKLEGTMKAGILRKERNMAATCSRKQELPACHFKIS